MIEEQNPIQDEAAFQVFVRVRPFTSQEKAATENNTPLPTRMAFNTIRIEENAVLLFQKKYFRS